jgi:hypothetical protein
VLLSAAAEWRGANGLVGFVVGDAMDDYTLREMISEAIKLDDYHRASFEAFEARQAEERECVHKSFNYTNDSGGLPPHELLKVRAWLERSPPEPQPATTLTAEQTRRVIETYVKAIGSELLKEIEQLQQQINELRVKLDNTSTVVFMGEAPSEDTLKQAKAALLSFRGRNVAA